MNFLAALLNLALLTTNEYPESRKLDDKLLIEALRKYEVETQYLDWKTPDVKWNDFDAVLVYSTWDYFDSYDEFLSLLTEIEASGAKVLNSPSIIKWNSSKLYLKDLENLGLKTIESIYISSGELDNLKPILLEKGWDECVIKPQISAGGYNTFRFNLSNLESIQDYFKNFNEELIVQPFAEEIISEGEWSFVFFDKDYNHCVLKKPYDGDFLVQNGTRKPVEPPDWMIKEAKHIIETINLPSLKTRVDVIRRGNEIRIMEIEMIEPNLYLKYFPGSENKLAEKIRDRLDLIKAGKPMDFEGVQIKKSGIGQFADGLGCFANKDFKKGEIVIKWDLKILNHEEYQKLPKYEQENFCHFRKGAIYFYPDPERHVNRSKNPNVIPDFEKGANIALRDIKKGEELSISDQSIEDFE